MNKKSLVLLFALLLMSGLFYFRHSREGNAESTIAESTIAEELAKPLADLPEIPVRVEAKPHAQSNSVPSKEANTSPVYTANNISSAPSAALPPQPEAPLKDLLLRDPEGNFPFTGMTEAIAACGAQNLRLPTIRELAALAKKRGAKGILELREAGSTMPEGYQLVNVLQPGGGEDQFYYSSAGYKDPILPMVGKFNLVGMNSGIHELTTYSGHTPSGFLVYWSSSEAIGHHTDPDPALHSFYTFDIHGNIHDHYRTVKGLTRCLVPPENHESTPSARVGA